MLVNQIAVFLENRKGRVGDFARVLADNKIDLVSMSIADTKEFGILRAITRDNALAVKVLREAGFTVTSSDLIGIEVEDRAGGLSEVLDTLNNGDVEIEYLYSYARTEAKKAIILLKVSDINKAIDVIKASNIKVLEYSIVWFEGNILTKYIDVNNIKQNILKAKSIADCKVMAVVKADCYSNGMYIAKCIEDCVFAFAVANIYEAIRLRKLGVTKPILSLSYNKAEYKLFLENDIQASISSVDDYVPHLKYHVAVDTGMNRSGFKRIEQFYSLLCLLSYDEFVGIYSHIYSKNIVNIKSQIICFDKFLKLAKNKKLNIISHLYSTNSCYLNDFYRTDMVRIGMGMYENCVGVTSTIKQIKNLEKGESVGYDAEFIASKKMQIALVEGGYNDGILRCISGQNVAISTDFCKVLGKISMDSFSVDISNCNTKVGDIVVIYDTNELSFKQRAGLAKTSSYELMTALKGRFNYVYFN